MLGMSTHQSRTLSTRNLSLDRRTGTRLAATILTIAIGASLGAPEAEAKAHLWRISEIFSNADGNIQFIEINECCGSALERNLTASSLTSDANSWAFPTNLSGFPGTAFAWVLIGTDDFAALPGAPTPDYVLPPNFFDPAGDTITYVGGADAAILLPGALPTDGLHSLERDINTGVLTVAVNSPRNYLGDSGSVVPPPVVSTGIPWLMLGMLVMAGTAALVHRRNA